MDTLNIFVDACKKANTNGNGISESVAAKAAAALKTPLNETEQVINIMKQIKTEKPGPFKTSPWDEKTWEQVKKMVAERLPKKSEPKPNTTVAGLFGEEPETQLTSTKVTKQNDDDDDDDETLEDVIRSVARMKKAEDNETFELFSLGKGLDKMIVDAKIKFPGNFSRPDVEKWTIDTMTSIAGSREITTSIREEAEKRGWKFAPWPGINQPKIPTDKNQKIIGNSAQDALVQLVKYDNMTVKRALNSCGFTSVQKNGLFGC